ncbi:UNVERIFIED_CONTAM: hypothetical protein H355_000257 [Colinus virginianus]|nr:hypothetical protein H355_000257 [Colinus virginianus]
MVHDMVMHLWYRYLELESSGHRNEIRLHYRTGSHRSHTEVFPYILADDKWHRLSLAISASHLILHVDCNKIYERVVEKPFMDLPLGTNFWLGQRNNAHGYFKGIMQDVQLLVMPQGFISQCPDLNRTCPTCNDFHGLVQKIMELQDILAKTSAKNGTVQCEALICPLSDCPLNSALAYVDGKCCKECQFQVREEDDRSQKRDGRVDRLLMQGLVVDEGGGHDFCTEGHNCMEHSVCRNLDDRAVCSCRDGFRALREDNAYCEDIDECAEGQHYCRENTMCVNTPGSFMCICKTGYIRIDDYSCTEHDECVTNQHNCDENALCFNTVGGHNCVCKLGYTGNGTVCKAFCKDGCRNGGACIASNVCACPQGFTGPSCETDEYSNFLCVNFLLFCFSLEPDIDECSDGFVQCDSRANCINLPGWYHCECRDGYHDNGMFSPSGESCEEDETWRNSLKFNTVLKAELSVAEHSSMKAIAFSLVRSFHYEIEIPLLKDSVSTFYVSSPVFPVLETLMNVQLEGIAVPMTLFALIWMVGMTVGVHMARTAQETVSMKIKSSTMVRFGCWRTTDALSAHARSQADFCHHSVSVFQQQNGYVMCRRMVCDCENPTVDLFCCPECDPRLSSQCLHQSGELSYNSGDSWIQNCQQCRCLQGEVDCWPLPCPEVDCEFSVLPENECCPRCVADPCQADTIRNDITKTCLDETNVVRFTGSSWIKHGTECTLCQCKVRSIKLKLSCCFSSLFCAHKY